MAGTASGDPTEANWIGEQFKRDGEVLVGSVKGNIGRVSFTRVLHLNQLTFVFSHLEITAFLASLCKVVGMFKYRVIAPNVNLVDLNPAIKWKEWNLRVPVEPEHLPCRSDCGRPLIAMTSSGISGVNGHCVVEGPPIIHPHSNTFWLSEQRIPTLVIVAGLSPNSTASITSALGELLAEGHHEELARIYGRRARSLTWRAFALVSDEETPQFTQPVLVPKSAGPLVFVFSGQGPQHLHCKSPVTCCV